jgi:hypothetical protein
MVSETPLVRMMVGSATVAKYSGEVLAIAKAVILARVL